MEKKGYTKKLYERLSHFSRKNCEMSSSTLISKKSDNDREPTIIEDFTIKALTDLLGRYSREIEELKTELRKSKCETASLQKEFETFKKEKENIYPKSSLDMSKLRINECFTQGNSLGYNSFSSSEKPTVQEEKVKRRHKPKNKKHVDDNGTEFGFVEFQYSQTDSIKTGGKIKLEKAFEKCESKGNKEYNPEKRKCYICNNIGHVARKCPQIIEMQKEVELGKITTKKLSSKARNDYFK